MMIPAVSRQVRCSHCGAVSHTKVPETDPVVTDYDLYRIGWERIGDGVFCPWCIYNRPRILLKLSLLRSRLFGGDSDE